MEPVFMILGQSAATAAALAIDQKIALQDLAYANLEQRLLKDGQVLRWRTPQTSPSTPDQLLKDLQVLSQRKVLDDVDYWKQHAVPGGACDGTVVAEFLIKAARQFAPADSVEGAVAVLRAHQVLTSATYWQQNAVKGGWCSGTHLAKVIQNLARTLAVKD
jgi:hypothetical protein